VSAARSIAGRCAALAAFVALAASLAAPSAGAQQETTGPDSSLSEQRRLAGRIDAALAQAWKDQELKPAAPADDATFLRRLSLDLKSVIPSREEVVEFLASKAPDKREQKIEEYLADPAFARALSYLWSRALLTSAANGGERRELRPYLQERFAAHASFADVVRSLVAAEGRKKEDPSASFLLAYGGQPEALAGVTARALLGVQIQCAQCHDHPYDKWKQTDFKGFAGFFANVNKGAAMGMDADPERDRRAALEMLQKGYAGAQRAESGDDPDPRNAKRRRNRMSDAIADIDDPFTLETKDPALFQKCVSGMPAKVREKFDALVKRHRDLYEATFLDGKPYRATPDLPRRAALAEWMVDPDNPWFARATVNRLWDHLLGHGLIAPVDDLTGSGDVVCAALLEELGKEFTSHQTDLRFFAGALVRTRAYAAGNSALADAEARTKQERWFAARPLRPLEAEQMLHSLERATGRGAKGFDDSSGPQAENARDKLLAKYRYYFDDDEGGAADSFEGSLPEALFMMNGDRTNQLKRELNDVLSEIGTKEERFRALFQATLSRDPTGPERARLLPMITRDQKEAFGDLLWALLNSAEFKLER
jgi:uncharacterized protein DUF1549/uncharacterized protein DUF1553